MKKLLALFKNKQFVKRFLIVVVVLLLIGSYIAYQKIVDRVFIDDSLIQAPIITISPAGAGKVQEIDVTEGQNIQKGDQLAVVGSETIRSDTDGIITSASDITGSTVSPQTQLIQMINPVDMRV